ncbi:MAG: hypothetical protein IJ629_06570 [Clostridia bacterium]|nr:hypothetical protein [Clostridia bacterium]
MLSSQISHFKYSQIIKKSVTFQKKEENKNFLLSTISKELPINAINGKEQKTEEASSTEIQGERLIEEPEKLEVSEKKEEVLTVPVNLPTEVIQANNLSENYNTIYQSTKIKNETNFNLSQEILNPNVEFQDKTNVIIFHTHTCESYTQTNESSYTASRQFSNNRFKLFCC